MTGYYAYRMVLLCAAAVPVYGALRYLTVRKKCVSFSVERELAMAVFFVFSLALLALLFEGSDRSASVLERIENGLGINFVPFRTINSYAERSIDVFMTNIVGNVLAFVPIGLLAPYIWRKIAKWRFMLPISIVLPCMIELTQLFVGRSVDVDDVLLNGMGICLGFGVFKVFQALKRKNE